MLAGRPACFRQGDQGQILNTGDSRENLNVLNEQKLVAGALDPDIAEGKRSFLPGGLAVLGVWRLNDGGDGVAAAVTGLNVVSR